MKIKEILIGLTIAVLSSCNSWFEVEPSTNIREEVLYRDEQGFKDVMTGVYQIMATPTLYGRELSFGYNDARVRYWSTSTSSTGHVYYYAHNLDYTVTSEVARFDAIWSSMYKAISNLNGLLANIDAKKSVFAPGNYELIKGEAIALRAFLHFEILRFFSPSPAFGMDVKAIPYYTRQTVDPQPQKTISEVIDLVRTDINQARELMREHDPWGPAFSTFTQTQIDATDRFIKMNYWAVTGLLARVELYAGNKPAALAAAKELIGEPVDQPQLPIFLNSSGAPDQLFFSEVLFSMNISKLQDNIDFYFGPVATASATATGLMLTTAPYLDNLYSPLNPSDVEYRKNLWFDVTANNGNASTLKKYTDITFIPIIRISEVYYIAAEASENTNAGIDYLNKIRGSRGLFPMDYTINLAAQLKNEYIKEFVGEGQLWYYYKRLGSAGYGGPVSSTLAIAPEKYILPLPKAEIEFGKIE